MTETRSEIGSRLRWQRRQAGLTLKDAEARSGLNYTVLSRLESGARLPRPEHLIKLAVAYEVDPNLLLVGAGFLRIPGMDPSDLSPSADEMTALLSSATEHEKRELLKFLMGMRLMRSVWEEAQ